MTDAHRYEPSPHSGAGNCWCGHAERSVMHPEHKPMATWRDATRCTCSRPMADHPPVYDNGGVIPPGLTWIRNVSGEDEEVRPA